MFDTTVDDSSNGESVVEGSDLNVNAAAAKKQRPSILKRNREKKPFKASEMLAGVVPKMMVSKQMKVTTPERDKVAAYLTFLGNMANIDYSRCDSLVPSEEPFEEAHYKVNLLHSHEMEYRANLSNRDSVIGGKHLALADGGANGLIIGLDMKILYFNTDGKQVSIGISGDHQLTGNKLCCGCSVTNSSHGLIKLLWPVGARVKTQQNSILSIVQMQDKGCLVNDVAKAHGGTYTIMTPNGVRLRLVIKNWLPFLEHYYPTAKQNKKITREKFVTSKNT